MFENFKEAVVNEYLLGSVSQAQLAAKYGIGKSSVDRWIQKHRGRVPSKRLPIDCVISPVMIKEVRDDLPEDVQELRRQLEQEKLRNKLLTAMIDIAERDLKIPIRKKFGTKPSAK